MQQIESKWVCIIATWKVIAAIFMSIEITPALVPKRKKLEKDNELTGMML